MSEPLPPDGLPPLTPQSRRIQAGLAHFGVARALGVTSRPLPEFTPLESPVRELAVLTEAHLRPPIEPESRPIERPSAVEDWLEVCTAQFFLRNTHRVTRDDVNPDALEFARQPGSAALPPPDRAPIMPRVAPRLTVDLTSDEIASYVAFRGRLMVEPWPDHFGRPDPIEVQDD